MSDQSINLLNVGNSNSSKTPSEPSQTSNENTEREEETTISKQNDHAAMESTMANGLEMFTRLAYCQALLYKTWVEASDDLVKKVTRTKVNNLDHSKDLTCIYIDTFEEKFTDLFKSPEFSSNLSKLLNSLVKSLKEKDNISKIVLNTLPTYNLENNTASANE